MRFLVLVVVAVGSSVIQGCSGIAGAVRTIKGDNQEPIQANFSAADVNGTWTLPCSAELVPSTHNSYYESGSMVIANSQLTRNTTFWTDSACTSQVATQVQQTAGFYVVGAYSTDVRGIVMTSLTTSITPVSAAAATAMTADNFCGHQDWTNAAATSMAPTADCNALALANGAAVTGPGSVNAVDYTNLSGAIHIELGYAQSSGNGSSWSGSFSDTYTKAQ